MERLKVTGRQLKATLLNYMQEFQAKLMVEPPLEGSDLEDQITSAESCGLILLPCLHLGFVTHIISPAPLAN
jgi:hypothetical protein